MPDTSSPRAHRGRGLTTAGLIAVSAATLLMMAWAVFPAMVAQADPPGNNGTVKVDGVDFDDHPNNEPHVGCVFQIDFYGFDEGELFANVLFEAWPPTGVGQDLLSDVVFIGEDDNSGGGSEAGLDASETYTLDFTGLTPHPQQGFHVKLTVHADGSQGADTKFKVFWVTGCNPPTTTTGTTTTGTTTTGTTTTGTTTTGTTTTGTTTTGTTTTGTTTTGTTTTGTTTTGTTTTGTTTTGTTTTVPGGGGGTTTVPVTTTTSPTVGPTTVEPSTTTKSPIVAPTTVQPNGTAFTGPENVVPIGAIALMLLTSGSGLLWAGSRRKRDQDQE